MHNYLRFAICALVLTFILGCRSTPKVNVETIKIGLSSEPDKLHPMISTNGSMRQITNLLFQPLADLDPKTMELVPILIEAIPSTFLIDTGIYKGKEALRMKIRSEAKWDNGSEITSKDFLFTMKTALNPFVGASSWRSNLGSILDIIPENDKTILVVFKEPYFKNLEVAIGFPVFPTYLYDPQRKMELYSFSDLQDDEKVKSFSKKDSILSDFAKSFTDISHLRTAEGVQGSGPYKLKNWQAGQNLIIEKKKNWWGNNVKEKNSYFEAYPETIEYRFVSDNTTALNLLKEGELDVLGAIAPKSFLDLKTDATLKEKLDFFSPSILAYTSLNLNSKRNGLNELEVRKAIGHLVDIKNIVDVVLNGLGQPTIGPFHPSKSYYNSTLKNPTFSIQEANSLLESAGWKDIDGDGARDKMLNGKKASLKYDFLISAGNENENNISVLLKENMAKAGILINIKTMEFAAKNAQILKRDFDMTIRANVQDPGEDDPSQTWSTKSDTPDGSNISGFGDAITDAVIDSIRLAPNSISRKKHYLEFQKLLSDRQPVVFLYAPVERIAIRKNLQTVISSKRPCYSENLFQEKK
jgi:peptide/nickel transport system substrate-binding protein